MEAQQPENETRSIEDISKPVETAPAPKKVSRQANSGSLWLTKKIVIGLVGVIILASAIIGVSIGLVDGADTPDSSTVNSNATIKTNEFQALFLTNGQVYFGKLGNLDARYVTLTDIYYLQVQQNQQGTAADLNSQSQVSLAKLGSELHGPEDKMSVASNQVLFWENLKPDSKVVKAITAYQK